MSMNYADPPDWMKQERQEEDRQLYEETVRRSMTQDQLKAHIEAEFTGNHSRCCNLPRKAAYIAPTVTRVDAQPQEKPAVVAECFECFKPHEPQPERPNWFCKCGWR